MPDPIYLDHAATCERVDPLIAAGKVVVLGAHSTGTLVPNRILALSEMLNQAGATIGALLADYHVRFPLRRGMPREDVRSRLALPARTFEALVDAVRNALLAVTPEDCEGYFEHCGYSETAT